MPKYFSPVQNIWINREKTLVLPAERTGESLLSLQWPKWAIDEINKMIASGISQKDACKLLSKTVRESVQKL